MKYILNTLLLTLLLTSNTFANTRQRLSEIPSINFQVSNEIIKLSKLSDFNAADLVANKNIVLITDHRKIYVFKKGWNALQILDINNESHESAWFSPICVNSEDFIIYIADYPSVQQDKETSTGLGDFRADPSGQGFLIIENNLSNQRPIEPLKIVSRPPSQIGYENKEEEFSYLVQSCASYSDKMYLGNYGSFGKADFKKETIELIEEDEEMTFNRYPIFVEKEFIWIEKDEGGLGGTNLEKWSHKNTRLGDFNIYNDEDIISFTTFVRYKGQMIVGTSHGLFRLNEKNGRFTRFNLGKDIVAMPTQKLVQGNGYLWGFIDGQWFRIDTEKHTAIRQVNLNKNKFTNGVFFDGTWILIGPSGIWKKKK